MWYVVSKLHAGFGAATGSTREQPHVEVQVPVQADSKVAQTQA
tara:strand:- start:424 stop:552 length:129 start_codon:yes stop_codon:yes gene_type:complete